MTDQITNGNGGHDENLPLGLAGNLAKAFIKSPLSPLLLITCLCLGVLGLLSTPRQEDPQISVPMVDIFFSYAGASAEQVASLATDPLERLMSEIQGVEHVYSQSNRNGAIVTVQFEVGEDLEPSLVKLHDKIQSNLDKIPPGVSQPLIKPKGVDDVPVVTLTLWSHAVDEAALRSLGLDLLQRLKEVPDTSQSFIIGGRSEAIKIEVFPERLAGFGIGLDQLAQTIQTANSERGIGAVEQGNNSFTLYTGAFLRSAQDIETLMVGVSHGAPAYVRDVALVTEGTDDATDMVMYYTGPAYGAHGEDGAAHAAGELAPVGAPAVTIAVAKKQGSNGVTVADAVLEYVERLRGNLIPDNVHVEITRDYGETANEKVNELIFKLFVATGAVTVLIWLALGARAATVVVIVIPIVILMTVFSAWLLGYTIDRVSLFALIFSIGILVDDAIVVVENIYRRWLIKGECTADCNVDAVREVGNPTVLATFTVIAALLPMGFVSGMMGPYMEPIPALGSVAMIFSLFAAFMFTPWLAQKFRPPLKTLERAHRKEHRQTVFLENLYRRILVPLITDRLKGWVFGIGLLVVFMLCVLLFVTKDVTVKMLPKDNKPEFNVTVNMPEGTALPITANVVAQLTDRLLTIPEVTAAQSYVGTASPFNFNGLVRHTYLRQEPWMADIQVQLVHKHLRDKSSEILAVEARELLTDLAHELGARIEVIEMPPGPPVLQTMVAEIYGPDPATVRQVARDIERLFTEAETIVDVDSFLQIPYESWRFVVDRDKASRRGVSVETINRQLEMAMGGFRLGDVKSERSLEPRFIYLQIPLAVRGDLGRLGQLPVPSANGAMIPLAELGRFERFQMDDPVFHKDLRAVEFVTGEVAGRLGAPIYAILEMEALLDEYTAPDGVRVDTNYIGPPSDSLQSSLEWTGEWTVTYETFRDMGLAFGAALVLIYILVVWEFGNFTMPAIIMAPIPLTLMGIVPGHWFFGASFTATSMIGFIALAGIIVRNSILLVDFSRHAVEQGMRVQDAVVYSCQTRTRPIIITALALVAGSSVILSDPIFQGMAISLMFGGLVSTLLTLVVIPLGCVSFRKALVAGTDIPLSAVMEDAPNARLEAARQARGAGRASFTGFLGTVLGWLVSLVKLIWQLVTGLLGLLFSAWRNRRGGDGGGTPTGTGPTGGPAPAPQPAAAAAVPAARPQVVRKSTGPAAEAPAPAPAVSGRPQVVRKQAAVAEETVPAPAARPEVVRKPASGVAGPDAAATQAGKPKVVRKATQTQPPADEVPAPAARPKVVRKPAEPAPAADEVPARVEKPRAVRRTAAAAAAAAEAVEAAVEKPRAVLRSAKPAQEEAPAMAAEAATQPVASALPEKPAAKSKPRAKAKPRSKTAKQAKADKPATKSARRAKPAEKTADKAAEQAPVRKARAAGRKRRGIQLNDSLTGGEEN
jgi:multidrug efflux pump subunit AcrB